jgi:hypothetical protein
MMTQSKGACCHSKDAIPPINEAGKLPVNSRNTARGSNFDFLIRNQRCHLGEQQRHRGPDRGSNDQD